MENLKHTPGPWEYSHETKMVFSLDENGEADKGVCRVNNDKDAKLIAAAPELLELCQLVYGSFGGGSIITFSESDMANFESAIKKATE